MKKQIFLLLAAFFGANIYTSEIKGDYEAEMARRFLEKEYFLNRKMIPKEFVNDPKLRKKMALSYEYDNHFYRYAIHCQDEISRARKYCKELEQTMLKIKSELELDNKK